jgi:tetratricopeptide (TPR) repeat protein
MNHTPEQQWSALSALYEEADDLPAHELPGWLAQLERANNPLLPQLKRMLEAREHMSTDGFLGTLPKLSADAAGTSDWKEGARVGPYRLVKPLGEGGMAEVWLAERDDGAFKRQVAIKLPYPRPGRETFAIRFDRERDILATLRHPHIAGLYDAGVTKDGQAWLALEYVEGQPISLFCDERRVSVRDRVMLFRQVLLAVQHAHANLVIHRDLKPANILVTSQGEVRLLDFGIAKLLEAQGDAIEETELTRQAGRSMTPRYASPEQLTGLPLTTACDVYSLGVVFYELVSGERPYDLKVESPAQLEHAILEAEPRAPSRRALSDALAEVRGTTVKGLRKVLAPELDAIALRCLEKKPSARYLSVDAVLADVDRWLGGEAVLARAPGAWYRFGKFAKRHRLGVGLGITAVASLAVVASVAVVMGLQARQESARAIAAKDFMLTLFQRADQEKARGAALTAREILETGRKDLLTRLASQPQLQGELLEGIALIQMEMGEYANAETTFEDAAQIYLQLGISKREALVRAEHADNALRMGDAQRAAEILQTAKMVPGVQPQDPEIAARFADVAGWIASIRGNAEEARSLFLESRRQAATAYRADDIRSLRPLRGLIRAEQLLHNFDAALALQTELETASIQSFSTDPKQRTSADLERAELLTQAGHYAQGFAHMESALPRCREKLGPNDEICRRLLTNKAVVLLRTGRQDEARELMPSLLAMVNDQKTPAISVEALLVAVRIAQPLDSPSRSELQGMVSKLGMSGAEVPINPVLKVKALLVLSEAMLHEGRSEEALRLLDRVADPDRNGLHAPLPSFAMGIAQGLRGVALLQQNMLDQALKSFDSASAALLTAVGSSHPLRHMFLLDQALVLEAMGRSPEANKLVESIHASLGEALGPESPGFQKISSLRDRLRKQAGLTGVSNERPLRRPAAGGQQTVDFFS